jgi:hypothetical protein
MESFQLDQASNELGLQADLDTLFVAPAPPCPAILPGGDSLPIFRGATGSGLAGPTGLGPAPPPSAVAAAFAAARPLPAQSAPASAAPSSQQKDPTDVERKAIAREKNRMAQRRFRWVLPRPHPRRRRSLDSSLPLCIRHGRPCHAVDP